MKVSSHRRFSTVRIHERIQADLQKRIGQGQWPPGALIPGCKQLAGEYGVSVGSVHQAITDLVRDGVLRTDNRRGTFVVESENTSRDSASRVRASTEELRAFTSASIGIVAGFDPDSADDWTLTILESFERTAAAGGARLFLSNLLPLRGQTPNQAPKTMAQAVEELTKQGAEAFAFFSIYDYDANHFAERVMSAVDIERVPAVLISWDDLRAPVPHVFYDNHYAGYQAAQHLLQNGCEQLIFLAPFDADWARQRIVGARLAVSAAGLTPEVLTEYPSGTLPVRWAEDIELVIETFARELMAPPRKKSPRVGVIAAHDDVAHRLLDKVHGKRRKMGRDFAVIGFDDAPRSRVLGLTSLRPPLEDLGAEAARLLLQRLRGNVTSTQVRLCSHLVPRLSTQFKQESEK